MEAVIAGLKSGLTDGAAAILTFIGELVPIVLPVMLGIVVVGIGIKVFRKITGR